MFSTANLIAQLTDRKSAFEVTGLGGAEGAFLLSRICLRLSMPIVAVLPNLKAAGRFVEDLKFFSGETNRPIRTYPPYNILSHRRMAFHNETAALRISTLYRLATEHPPPVVVTTPGALMKKVLPKDELLGYAELVMVGEDLERDVFVEKLVSGGYDHSALVEEPGDYSVRGGIIDLYSPLHDHPLRIEFFGDTVDTIRTFDPASQRTLGNIQEAVILPAREAIVHGNRIDAIVGRIRARAAALELPVETIREWVNQVRGERTFGGIESLLSIVFPELESPLDYMPENTLFVCYEPGELDRAASEYHEQIAAGAVADQAGGKFYVDAETLYGDWPRVWTRIAARRPLSIKALSVVQPQAEPGPLTVHGHFSVSDNAEVRILLKNSRQREALLAPLVNWIQEHLETGGRVVMVGRTRSQVRRLESLLGHYHIATRTADRPLGTDSYPKGVTLCLGALTAGFVWPGESLAVITAEEIFGSTARPTRQTRQGAKGVPVSFSDLKQGDLVVHTDHGIGQYEGLIKLSLNGSTNDFLLLLYKDGDKLYLPVDRMNVIQKYMGVEGVTPVLNKMGGRAWDKIKSRVKRSAEKIAGQLLKLYAARRVETGHSFSGPDDFFRDFEATFPFEETDDQAKAINQVLADMEATVPMDRLVCGDVGYGKTEVALRAAFKAINDGKQVAILVPTTVLAEQHFRTFAERFEPYPVQVACLTRFRSTAEQRRIVQEMKKGKVDIVIGTHRLLQKDIGFKDLGLLIFDEEHRFGVKHKEKLKRLKKTVDVLALTATPIPRTLHLSLAGIRDISVISTPPEDRRAIITYISELDDAIVTEAIRKELNRGGQTFFVHNNIHSIWRMAKRLQSLVPEMRLSVAHGRMAEEELEKVMLDFLDRKVDVLLCTTIVESGLDIPSANSILINRADRMGLAQMYQLRGRVGRADEQAFAYLFIPPESLLSKAATKRLKVLMEHSDLGSGFQIAMNDLKIRGGGTILGASQSGHIAAVGYDMFLQLMEQAINEQKGMPAQVPLDPEINVAFSAFIPESYIPDIDQRLSSYRRLAKMTEIKEISDFKDEMTDRFGAVPQEAGNLLLKIMLKVLSLQAGVERLDLDGRKLALHFSSTHLKNPDNVLRMVRNGGDKFRFGPDHVLHVDLPASRRGSTMALAKNLLKEIIQHGIL